jgi:ABC-2 type transport system ATP-binding protein
VPPTIETNNLAKHFGRGSLLSRLASRGARRAGVAALEDVTFSLAAGDVAAVTGHNGAGKSTLLRVLATVLLPSAGSATVCGHDVAHDDINVRRHVALVTGDDRSFSLRLTGRENLRFFAGLYGLRGTVRDWAVDRALARVMLTAAGDDAYASYSAGMRQRLALARGLVVDAPVLLLDEPFRALDEEAAMRLRDLVRGLAVSDGVTVMVATHNLDEMPWTRVLRLHHGRLVADSVPLEVAA